MVAEIIAFAVLVFTAVAELIHQQRISRIAVLAFGPGRLPALTGLAAPFLRTLSMAALAWGLATLAFSDPRVFRAEVLPENEVEHVVIVLDVSPSMKLVDAGPKADVSRSQRVSQLMESFFKRVVMEKVRLSIIAVYTGAKPVVIDTRDVEVVRNILDDLPMYQAFNPGQTDLLAGIRSAVEISASWRKDSTTIIVLSDGDSVPPAGMPAMPPSVRGSIVVGVGDPRSGKFINGYQSRQDVSTLRQIATRMSGLYHNGNEKQISSSVLSSLMNVDSDSPFEELTRREYALAAVGVSSFILALLPWLLVHCGTPWKPGAFRAGASPRSPGYSTSGRAKAM
jgi:Ca-activated chloride channel family protein